MTTNKDGARPTEWMSADKPIERRKEDMLGRGGFAEVLARAIRGWSGQESLVIALYGAWGNGKSSIKNMVLDCLQSEPAQPTTVDFNPWQLANRPSLSEAFFDELGIALGKGDLGSNSLRKSVLARYRRWAHRLQGSRDLVQAIANLFGVVLLVLGAATIGAAWIQSRTFTFVLAFLLLASGALALVSRFVSAIIKFSEAGTEIGTKSLSDVKKEIGRDLKSLKSPILVVLDDLDRLTPQEALEVFQLIKANGDFPNLVYLVLCDRSIVETNVSKVLNVSGRDYLEKIVQVAFDVPMIDALRVQNVLFQRLDLLLSPEPIQSKFSPKRWTNVFLSGLRPYFVTLRDVNRFVSTLAFHFSSFSTDGAFEVNPIDLIVLEVIRLREPDVYKSLQANKDILTTNGRPERPLIAGTEKTVASIIELGSQERREQLRELIKHLFPTIEWALGRTHYANELPERWYRDLRVCSGKMFDRYFRLTVSEKELSQAKVQRLLASRGNPNELRSNLESLNSEGLLDIALEELAVHEDTIQPAEVQAFVTAIFDVCDVLPDRSGGLLDLPWTWRVAFLVRNVVERLENHDTRLSALTDAISATRGLFMAVEFVFLMDAPAEAGGKEPLLSQDQLVKAKESALRKIKNAAASGALALHPKLAILLSLWSKWGERKDVSKYIEELTKTEAGTLQLLRSLVVRSVSYGAGDYTGTERYFMRRADIETLMPMDALEARVQKLPATDKLTEEDGRAVGAFRKAVERRNTGKHDDDPFARD